MPTPQSLGSCSNNVIDFVVTVVVVIIYNNQNSAVIG